MKTTIEFLDELKRVHALPSDYAAAKLIGAEPNRISNYRTGTSRFDDDMAVRVAELLQIEPAYVLACVAAERTKSERARRTWEKLAKKLAGAGALLLLLALLSPYSEAVAASGALHIM